MFMATEKANPAVPRHVAIIMDGNGRWAQKRGRPRIFGHVRGSSRVKAVAREADRLGIRALTLFAFSTENWQRPEAELRVLWKLLKKFLKREIEDLDRNNVRLRILGEKERLADDVQSVVDAAVERLSGNTGLQLNFAVSYGSRRELVRAARAFAEDCVSGKRAPEDLDEAVFSDYLWTAPLGELADVDLVIRPSGEYRVSNFLLWQSAYAEYDFEPDSWPEYSAEHLRRAVERFGRRDRRFGGLKTTGGPESRAGELSH